MKKLLKRSAVSFIRSLGYSIHPINDQYHNIAVELDDSDVDLIKHVLDGGLTMTSVPRLVNTLKSCRYVVENKIPGDFVECGVWRGGNGILAKKLFNALNSQRRVWMFDTFEGMTEPTEFDVAAQTKRRASEKYNASQLDTHNEWCFASLNDVRKNCVKSGLDVNDIRFVKGDVGKTLLEEENIPHEICILRLDTDWYESTKAELHTLYPILSEGGVLIIDDYGHWEGARKAVDEYFSVMDYKPLFNVIDFTGRSAIKI